MLTLRAAAFKRGDFPSKAVTHSYIFPDHVPAQPGRPSGFPEKWDIVSADYEMDPRVVEDPADGEFIRQGLTSIPTLSIVTDVSHLFGRSGGIYANPSRNGSEWSAVSG